MPKRKMIKVGVRRLEKYIGRASWNLECRTCVMFKTCKNRINIDGPGSGWTYNDYDGCNDELTRWLTCQK